MEEDVRIPIETDLAGPVVGDRELAGPGIRLATQIEVGALDDDELPPVGLDDLDVEPELPRQFPGLVAGDDQTVAIGNDRAAGAGALEGALEQVVTALRPLVSVMGIGLQIGDTLQDFDFHGWAAFSGHAAHEGSVHLAH